MTDDTNQATPSATKASEEETAVTVADPAAQADQPAEATDAATEAASAEAAIPEAAAPPAPQPDPDEVADEAEPMEPVSAEAAAVTAGRKEVRGDFSALFDADETDADAEVTS